MDRLKNLRGYVMRFWTFLKMVGNHRLLFWVVLAWPSPEFISELFRPERYYAELMHGTGVLSAQLLVVSLAVTPAMRLTRGWAPVRWLSKRRRYIGVACFGYALLHTVFYIRETGGLDLVWLDLSDIELAIGWVAMCLLAVLATISNNKSVRRLGTVWKLIQRSVYVAAAAVFLHWILIDFFISDVLIWFVPLILLQLARGLASLPMRDGRQATGKRQNEVD